MPDDESFVDAVMDDAKEKMAKAVSHTQADFSNVRTGRASSGLVENLKVDYYGTETALKQIAGFNVPEARLLVITPYDKSSLKAIEKAIQNSDIGINPSNDGTVIRLTFPALTEERRKELVKIIHKLAEEGRVAVRHARGDAMTKVKKLSGLPKDDVTRAEKEIQKFTDEHIKQIDTLIQTKEQELLQV